MRRWSSQFISSAWRSGWRVRRAESRVRVISGSPRPAWRAAAASGLRSAAGLASSARLAAQYRPALRLPSGWRATQRASWLEPAVSGVAWCRVFVLPLGFQETGDGGPVQGAVAAGSADHEVGLAADLGGRGHDVTAGGAEVEVVAGQAAIVLVRASEVGVHSAGRGPYVGGGAVDQSGAAQAGEGRGSRFRLGRAGRCPGRRGRGCRWRWPGSTAGRGRTIR